MEHDGVPFQSGARTDDPRDVYTRALAARRASLAAAVRAHVSWGNARVVAFAAVLVAGFGAFVLDLMSGWWLVAPAAAFVWVGGPLERAVRARARLERAVAFYERALARLEGRWAGTGETGERFLDDQHLYARDLDLFGPSSLFQLLSAARTRMGEETLAAWLKAPASADVVRGRQDAVKELAPRSDLREDLAVLGEDVRTGVHPAALAAWGERTPRLASPAVPAFAWLVTAAGTAAVPAMIVALCEALGLVTLDVQTAAALRAYALTAYGLCGAILWRRRARTSLVIREVDDAAHDLALLAGVLARLESERFECARLTTLRRALDVDGEPPSRRIAALDALRSLVDSRDNVFVRLFGPLVLWDLHLAYAIERWRRSSGPSVRGWLEAVGEVEALSSLAGYRFEHPDDVVPELLDGAPCFDGEGLGHPLLPADVMVRNDVRLCGDLRVLVVSGSNMSGKSTLLRTVGVNAVLALAGGTVRAHRLRLTPFAVTASIRVDDSLQAGVSRFYAEVRRLGEIMRRAGGSPTVLFLIDELLHGTNSHDRRIGAEAIVRGLLERGAVGLVTTHDLALAQVAEALGPRGANVHFADVLEDGHMRFDYRMRPGVVENSNALALMRSVGLDV